MRSLHAKTIIIVCITYMFRSHKVRFTKFLWVNVHQYFLSTPLQPISGFSIVPYETISENIIFCHRPNGIKRIHFNREYCYILTPTEFIITISNLLNQNVMSQNNHNNHVKDMTQIALYICKCIKIISAIQKLQISYF